MNLLFAVIAVGLTLWVLVWLFRTRPPEVHGDMTKELDRSTLSLQGERPSNPELTGGSKFERQRGLYLYWSPSDGPIERSAIELSEPIPESFDVLLPVALPEGEVAWLGGEGREPVPVVVRDRSEAGDRFRVAFQRSILDRRRASRTLTRGTAMVQWVGSDGSSRRVSVEVIDVSDEGLGLMSQEDLPLNEVVRLTGEDLACVAIVRSCAKDGSHFRVGSQVVDQHSQPNESRPTVSEPKDPSPPDPPLSRYTR